MKKEQQQIKVGSEVFLEQAWEDSNGNVRDCQATVRSIAKDGRLKFSAALAVDVELKPRNQKALEKKICTFLNQCEWYAKDVKLA